MSKIVWLINPVAMPPDREVRFQTQKRATFLANLGFEPIVICGSYFHNSGTNIAGSNPALWTQQYNGINYVHIRVTSYSNHIGRVLSLSLFYTRLFLFCKRLKKPDYINEVATIPFSLTVVVLAKRLKAVHIVDVLDLWPESFFEYGILSRASLAGKALRITERYLYLKAHGVVFSMEGGKDYLEQNNWLGLSKGRIDPSKITYINNGVDLVEFKDNLDKYPVSDSDLEASGIFRVIYMGSLRLANDISLLLEAAKILKLHEDIVFLIYGDGPDRKNIIKSVKDSDLQNVKIKAKWTNFNHLPFILSRASLNILNYKSSDIFRFGGSQSKSFLYMASGKPICCNVQMGYCPIEKHNLGIARNFPDAESYARAILDIKNMKESEYQELCENSLAAAKEYDYAKLTENFAEFLLRIESDIIR